MIFHIQRGKHISANFYWIDFVVNNTDIMTCLNQAALQVKQVSSNTYEGKIFGVKVKIEHLKHEHLGKRGYLRALADVRLPFSLGRTYGTGSHLYYAIDDQTTSMELSIELELTGLMSLYARLRKRSIYDYIDRICGDIENAAHILASEDDSVRSLLDENQRTRIENYRKHIKHAGPLVSLATPHLEASVRISVVNEVMLIEADALMPDHHFLTAKNEICEDSAKHQATQAAAGRLARINNPALAIRGEAFDNDKSIEFHQEAFEFGYRLYKDYFRGNLTSIMPVLLHHGKETFLRLNVDESLERVPWEALHDGKDFIATRLCFSRCLGAARDNRVKATGDISQLGILLIGPDSRGDLPGTIAEIKAIEKILCEIGVTNVHCLYGPEANRQQVLEMIRYGQANVLHFSGHSVFHTDSPYQSYLELAQGTKLSLYEFDNLTDSESSRNPLKMVFLNSCQSGRIGTDQTTGKNLSMCRIFRESGVDYVIGMLWNVSDEAAAQVASIFYEFLATGQGLGVAEAMRQTRLRVAMDRAWQDGSWLAPVLYT